MIGAKPQTAQPITIESVNAALKKLAVLAKRHPGLFHPDDLRAAAAALLAERDRLNRGDDIDRILRDLAG